MNVIPLTNLKALIRLLPACLCLLVLWGQLGAQGTHKPLVSLKNSSVNDTISGVNLTVYISSPTAKHGTTTKTLISAGGGNTPHVYQIKYTPHPGFIGLDTFIVELNYNGFTPFLLYRAYAVTVLPSKLTAVNDFVVTQINTPVTIPVLANDHSTSGGLNVTSVPLSNHGTAQVSGNQVFFTPDAGFSGVAHVNYTVCDAVCHCKTASANISVQNGQPPLSDTIYLTTIKNANLDYVLRFDGYSIAQAPDSGSVQMQNGYAFSYTPRAGFAGVETFSLVNHSFGAPRYLHVYASVINTPSPNTMAIDDYVYTAKGTPVTFSVRANDIGNLGVMGWTPPATIQGSISGTNSSGNVTFTPNPNFKGVATFRYRVGSLWNNNVETATVYVMVGDLAPTQSTYDLSTPEATPLVINYRLPFIGYDFAIVQAPLHGSTAFYPGFTTFTHGTQAVSGNNLLVYTPSSGYTGNDEMVVNYCITATNTCHTVKISISVNEVVSTVGPYCLENCVWSGDVNADGIVNNKDILPLGYFMGVSGEDRPNATLEWYGQYADNWNNPFSQAPFDLKHADTDGNGTISLSDTVAIHELYGHTHNLVPALPPVGKGLPFVYHLLTPNPQEGDLVQVEVQLGKTADPALNVFGFTLDVTLSQNIVDSMFQIEFYPNTWLNNNASSLAFSKRPRRGKLESAFTRIGNTSVSGMNDRIAKYEFIIIEVIDDVKGNVNPMLTMQVNGGDVMYNDGTSGYIEPFMFEIPVGVPTKSTSAVQWVNDAQLFAFPSPASTELTVHLNGDHLIEQLSVYNMSGQLVQQVNGLNHERTQVNTSSLNDGVYILKASTTGGTVVKKFVVKQ